MDERSCWRGHPKSRSLLSIESRLTDPLRTLSFVPEVHRIILGPMLAKRWDARLQSGGLEPFRHPAARSENRARHAVARRRDTALAKVLETGGPAGSGRAPCGFAVCGAPARSRSMGRPWTRDAPVPAVDSGWSLGLRHRLLYRANRLPLHRVQADHHSSRRAAVSTPAWVGAAWMGLDANDHPLVVADRSSTALYAFDWEPP